MRFYQLAEFIVEITGPPGIIRREKHAIVIIQHNLAQIRIIGFESYSDNKFYVGFREYVLRFDEIRML